MKKTILLLLTLASLSLSIGCDQDQEVVVPDREKLKTEKVEIKQLGN